MNRIFVFVLVASLFTFGCGGPAPDQSTAADATMPDDEVHAGAQMKRVPVLPFKAVVEHHKRMIELLKITVNNISRDITRPDKRLIPQRAAHFGAGNDMRQKLDIDRHIII